MRHIKKIGYLSLLGMLPFVSHADEGEKIYLKGGEKPQALACVTCHGAEGHGLAAAGYPDITGMSPEYLAKQLHDFQDGLRSHPIMDGIAGNLDDDEIEAVTFICLNCNLKKYHISQEQRHQQMLAVN